jgi:hypothetical protein
MAEYGYWPNRKSRRNQGGNGPTRDPDKRRIKLVAMEVATSNVRKNAQKPDAKRDTGSVKDGSCSDRALISACSALLEASTSKEVTPPTAAARALKPVWPTRPAQVRPAMGLIRELILKLDERVRKLHSDLLLASHKCETRP